MTDRELPPDRDFENFFNEIISHRQVSKLRRVLAANPELINTSVNYQGWTPLILAARANSMEIASVLVQSFNAKVNIRDNHGLTPLMHVVLAAGPRAQCLAQYFWTTRANVLAKSRSLETALDMARGDDTLARMLSYYAVNGPYRRRSYGQAEHRGLELVAGDA